jgi:hypothetical protein
MMAAAPQSDLPTWMLKQPVSRLTAQQDQKERCDQ